MKTYVNKVLTELQTWRTFLRQRHAYNVNVVV